MAVNNLEIKNAGDYGAFYFTVELEGTTYEFDFQYNSREGYWYFDMRDVDGNELRSGVKVVANWPSLLRYRALTRPPGEIVFVNTLDQAVDPGLDELGIDSVMQYTEEESLP